MKNKTSIYTEIPSQAFEAVKSGEWSLKEFEEYIEYVEERGAERQDAADPDYPYLYPSTVLEDEK